MSSAKRFTRRRFLSRSAAAAFGVPLVVSSSALGLNGQVAPSARIQLAAIGVGGRGSGVFRSLVQRRGVQPLAVCDVLASRLPRFAD